MLPMSAHDEKPVARRVVLHGLFRTAGALRDSNATEAFRSYEALLRDHIGLKQKGAERLSSAFAPRTRGGLFVRNLVVNASTVPGLARLAFGRDIIDKLPLPDYRWP